MPDEQELFDSDAEKKAYARGVADTAAKLADPPLTIEDVRNMSVAEIVKRKREVDEVLRRPRERVKDDE